MGSVHAWKRKKYGRTQKVLLARSSEIGLFFEILTRSLQSGTGEIK